MDRNLMVYYLVCAFLLSLLVYLFVLIDLEELCMPNSMIFCLLFWFFIGSLNVWIYSNIWY